MERYEIRVEGHLGPEWSEWLGGLEVGHEPCGQTVLSGPLQDQAALYSVLIRLRDLGLALAAVKRVDEEMHPQGAGGQK